MKNETENRANQYKAKLNGIQIQLLCVLYENQVMSTFSTFAESSFPTEKAKQFNDS